MTNDPLASLSASLGDRYRVDRELGRGGMATVYLAHDLRLSRPVAIKVLRPELSAILGAERFAREIRITRQLSHPNILPVLDSGEYAATGLCWYSMPFVDGESLRERMKRETQLPIDEALRLFGQVADALDHAHRQGFVHRDLKPENILLWDNHVCVADFGIARSMDAVGSDKLTQTGLALGTPQYMSPEQASGLGNLDARSDVYALGCILYEMLAGNPPFQGPTVQAIMARHAMDPVPTLRTVRSTVPASVEAAIIKAMAKVPADRFDSAAQFVAALDQPVLVSSSGTRSLAARQRALVAGSIIVLALVAVGGWLFRHSRRPTVVPSASVIAVMPLVSSGDTALARLGRDLALTISANLDGQGGIRAADPQQVLARAGDGGDDKTLDAMALARSLGAGSVLQGSLVRVGPDAQLDLKLVSTTGDSAPIARVTLRNAPDSISALTDSITWSVLRQIWRRGEPPSPSYANLTTHSVQALRAFLDGERLSAAGRWREAADAYAAAVEADSSLWLAGWGFNNTQGWLLDGKGEDILTSGYQAHLSSFGERDRLLIEADIGADNLPEEDYLARFRALTTRFPQDWPVWFRYADLLFHAGPTVGYSSADVRAALQRTVDLNPKLVPMWEHLLAASLSQDSAQAALAARSLEELGAYAGKSSRAGYDVTLFNRVALSAAGHFPAASLDSLAAGVTSDKRPFQRLVGTFGFLMMGLPQAQVELSRRLVAREPTGPFAGFSWESLGDGWSARGAWDSALVALDHAATVTPPDALRPLHQDALLLYQKVVAGASLGGLDTARAAARQAAAVKYLATLPPDSAHPRKGQSRLAWADGMLAVLRRDRPGLADARVRVEQSGDPGADFLGRSLAGFELELRGQKHAAAESLATLDLAATDAELWAGARRDPYARSLNHLAASRLLLELGDTTRAIRLLAWHSAHPPASPDPGRFQLFSALAYLALARIEEAQGRADLARNHYEQFLRRYDMPPPAHQYMVDEANAALKRLSGQDDSPAPVR
jgi:tetratricopeptide (TPR) repeat protein